MHTRVNSDTHLTDDSSSKVESSDVPMKRSQVSPFFLLLMLLIRVSIVDFFFSLSSRQGRDQQLLLLCKSLAMGAASNSYSTTVAPNIATMNK